MRGASLRPGCRRRAASAVTERRSHAALARPARFTGWPPRRGRGSDGFPALYPLAAASPCYQLARECRCAGRRRPRAAGAALRDTPPRIERIEVGERATKPWQGRQSAAERHPGAEPPARTPDGESYAYSHTPYQRLYSAHRAYKIEQRDRANAAALASSRTCISLLGEGGWASLPRPRRAPVSRVALKVVHADLAQISSASDASSTRPSRGALNHPNIVAVYDTVRTMARPT